MPDSSPDSKDLPVYIAKRLKDAQRLEEVFRQANIEYEVSPEEYQGGVIFRSTRVGAFFYVADEVRAQAENIMRENGFRPSALHKL